MRGNNSNKGWAVVTGASSGMGLAFARELARRGHKVLAVARRRDRLEALAAETAEQGGTVATLATDLETAEGLKLVVTRMASLDNINIASVVAFQPFPHFAVYAASKAFVLSFTEALAEEVKGSGVRVLALCPGAAKTEMNVFSNNEGLLGKLPSLSVDQIVSTALRAVEAGRVVKIVGWLNRMLVFQNRFMPRTAVRWIMGVIAKPPSNRSAPR
jgi:uncharacterized protein